ncbi:Serine/threonine-protein phosphatase 2A activator 2 [Physocladia obscura]|uniref:Serine/threonine-protein phosphatase 2A activator n=1 Tax=Physocladia obscura TaxID=109957 RepID=A0AAD5SPK0_9FUNG|nr:Serine/threonine-protein phosphatase 2A activator 2 [Physocladia obscura]
METQPQTHTHSDRCNHEYEHEQKQVHDHKDSNIRAHSDPEITARTPRKAILSADDLTRWSTSDTRAAFVGFITRLNDATKNRRLTDQFIVVSPAAAAVLAILEQCEAWCQEFQPIANTASRFGNRAFVDWFDRLQSTALALAQTIVSDPLDAHETSIYLVHSFGNRTRIDYGTGHEAHFMAFLFCLDKLGIITADDYPAIVLRVFWRYISVMRTLQFTYWLEPAGSHGVWGLDDYHFLPFLFGSAQFYDHKHLRPKCIHDPEILEEFSKDYMYLSCIKFINSIKTASLRWHSPMIDDISGVKNWQKVNSGMLKMYNAEVLSKLPIMQHFLFGTFLPFEASGEMIGEDDELGHVHALGQERPECCFIRVPSAIAAAAADQSGRSEFGLRDFGIVGGALGGMRPKPVPFD